MKAEGLDEIEVRRLWTTIRIVRQQGTVLSGESRDEELFTVSAGLPVNSSAPAIEKTPEEIPGSAEASDDTSGYIVCEEEKDGENALAEIESPMVGTLYLASSPESGAFVSIGQHIEVGQTVCIIEAMKLMNEIESDKAGIIRKILVKDSQPVEFGQPLFLIESA